MIKWFFDKVFEEFTFLGGILFYGLVCLWFLFGEKYDYFIMLFAGAILIYVVAFLIRLFYFKNRPKKMKYRGFIEKIDASSFPSVHAARITLLFVFFKDLILISLSFMILVMVLSSRIYLKKHYFSDLLGGIFLGLFTSLIFLTN
jgi:membrane-associated phospholipid phosphatase